ncbi:hypothetical protein GGR52DRAFT_385301 [Hypoxylon sp. FL1284]|nr:hypothetical protein GGR52DRAFT_385301 [Hypoxylon sp. FL1284]
MMLAESTVSVAEETHHTTPSILVREPAEGDNSPTCKWKGKEKVTAASKGDEVGVVDQPSSEITVDWTKYEPPVGLRNTADSKSETIIKLIQDSIDKVKARIAEQEERRKAEQEERQKAEQEERRKAEEEAERATQEETPKQKSETKEDNRESDWPLPETKTDIAAEAEITEPQDFATLELPPRPKKRSLMRLFRRLNTTKENGESSTTGAVRYGHDDVRSSMEPKTYAAKKRLVSEVLRKTAPHSHRSPDTSVLETEVECVSCLDDFSPKIMVKTPCHSYCKPCFQRLVSTACENEQQWPPKCCLNNIPRKTIVPNVDDGLKNTYRDRTDEWDLPVNKRIYCSYPDCGVWVRSRHVNRATKVAKCPEGHQTCTICRGPRHKSGNCPQDRDMIRTDELAEQEGWKRCYGCHAYVEHKDACQHMTCRCGAQFCYVCGAPWRTCNCTMGQLEDLKSGAATRRQARLDRELEEDAEVQEALRLVEDFVREEERRRAVRAKFEEMDEIFAQVHVLQRIIVQRDHKTEESKLESEGATALADLRKKQETEREEMRSAAEAKLTEQEDALNCELAARVAEERRMEEEYRAVLKPYWSCRPDGEAKAEAAMKEFMCKMDDGYRTWERWRDGQRDDHQWRAKEEDAIKEELMQESERRLAESERAKQVAFSLRKVAELRWVHEVIEERGRMLADMENDEIENDEIENGEDVEAWFAEEPIDDGSIVDMDLLNEFPVRGAYPWPLRW